MISQRKPRLKDREKNQKNLTSQEYPRLYPTGSCPGKFCAMAKIHKIFHTNNVDELPVRLIV